MRQQNGYYPSCQLRYPPRYPPSALTPFTYGKSAAMMYVTLCKVRLYHQVLSWIIYFNIYKTLCQ